MNNDKELEKKLEKSYKRVSVVAVIIGLIFYLPVFLIPKNYINIYVIMWLFLFSAIILVSPKIVNKIWKN